MGRFLPVFPRGQGWDLAGSVRQAVCQVVSAGPRE